MPKLAHFRAKHDALPLAASAPETAAAILHVDMDAFFVSVELLARPELKGLPVVVGGQRDQRGVVTSASYEARRFGVHSAMPLRTAAKLCPHAVFLDGHHELYGQWSDRVAGILAKYSPIVEMASIDEAYIDLPEPSGCTGLLSRAAHELLRARSLRRQGFRARAGSARRAWSPRWPASRPSREGWFGCRRAARRHFSRRSPCGGFPASAR